MSPPLTPAICPQVGVCRLRLGRPCGVLGKALDPLKKGEGAGCFYLSPVPPAVDNFCAPQTAAKVTMSRSDDKALITGSSLLCLIIE